MNKIWKSWQLFFFEPSVLTPIALYRILFGLLVLYTLVSQIGFDFMTWYGPGAILSVESVSRYYWSGRPFFDVMLLFPHNQLLLNLYFVSLIVAALFVTIGFGTRYSSIWVCFGLISLFNHNPYIFNGGDALLKLNSIFLAAAPSGSALSLDSYLRRRRGLCNPSTYFPWAQRMIQLQLCFAYASTFFWKLGGEQWQRGTAVYYAVRLEDLARVQVPFIFDNLFCCQILTYLTLIIELAGWTLIWFKPVRYYVLSGLFLLHFGIDIFMNLPGFQWIFISTLVLFIEGSDLDRLLRVFKSIWSGGVQKFLPTAHSVG